MRGMIFGFSVLAIAAMPTMALADGDGAVTGAVGGAVAGADAPMSVKSWLRPLRLGLAWGRDTQRSHERRSV
jgi:hypothetical protein